MSKDMKCYKCLSNISYEHNKMCDIGCLWCWNCAVFQHKNYKDVIIKGHNRKCKDYIDYEYIDRKELEYKHYSNFCSILNKK